MALFGISMAAGPLVGGMLIASFGWRWLFWINVPVIAVALLLVALVIPESWGLRSRRIDPPGQVLLAVVLFLAVGLLIEAPRWGWASPGALAGLMVLVAALLAFVTIERRTAEWQAEYGRWQDRDLSVRAYAYLWADGIHLQARIEDQAECMLVLIGATPEGK